ncbi:MAG TPA: ATPase domain-containing protein [archaeon]|nr:ATPase domain-containing protein [archaeon]
MRVERIESGVPGLDDLLEGGFAKGSINLIAGTTGTCKTTLCTQFMWHGLQKGEKGVYITLEESAEDIKDEAAMFGMDFQKYVDEKKCIIEYVYPKNIAEIDFEIFKRIKEINATRFVLDSITLLGFYMEGTEKLRDKIFMLLQRLKKFGVTTLIIGEIPEDTKTLSRFGFEEFVADSVIVLHYLEYSAGGTPRSLAIRKMRRTNHGTDIYPFEVTGKGIVVRKG